MSALDATIAAILDRNAVPEPLRADAIRAIRGQISAALPQQKLLQKTWHSWCHGAPNFGAALALATDLLWEEKQ